MCLHISIIEIFILIENRKGALKASLFVVLLVTSMGRWFTQIEFCSLCDSISQFQFYFNLRGHMTQFQVFLCLWSVTNCSCIYKMPHLNMPPHICITVLEDLHNTAQMFAQRIVAAAAMSWRRCVSKYGKGHSVSVTRLRYLANHNSLDSWSIRAHRDFQNDELCKNVCFRMAGKSGATIMYSMWKITAWLHRQGLD